VVSHDVASNICQALDAGWLHRRIELPAGMSGRVLVRWLAGCEHDHPARVRAALRNVRVVGAGGDEVGWCRLPLSKPR
jgi:hypothetical protein